MKPYQKSRMAVGVLLLLFGVGLLAMLVYPELQQILQIEASWPLIVVGAGALLFVLGLFLSTPSLVIPACILAGIGGLLYWQNQTGNWESWAYAWTLIPGFSGVGQVLAGLLGSQQHREVQRGLWQIFVSLVLFLVFGSFLGHLSWLGPFWPLLLVLAGIILIIRSFVRKNL